MATLKQKASAAIIAASLAIAGPFIARQEGKKNQAYQDAIGVPTICYGHTDKVRMGQTKTNEECQKLLETDLLESSKIVEEYVTAPLTVYQRAALISFVFNVGPNNFIKSTLLRKLNAGDYDGAANEFLRWDYADGQKLPGLTKRRAAERNIFLTE